jgi:hypothetical protein
MNTPRQKRTKPKPWDQMDPGEQQAILDAVEEGGFGSELQARRIFQQEGFDARSFYFHDLDQDRTRELDIIGGPKLPDRIAIGGRVFYTIAAEVKSGYIWILGDEDEEDSSEHVISHQTPQWFNDQLAWRLTGDPQWMELESIVDGERLGAKSVVTSIFQKKQEKEMDAWYEAAVKVFKAAMEPRASAEFLPSEFYVGIPLVILDGNLLAARFSPEGTLSLEPRTQAKVLFTFASAKYPKQDIVIHLVTLDGLPGFLRQLRSDSEQGTKLGMEIYAKLMAEAKVRPDTKS